MKSERILVELPAAAEWSETENMASNLRATAGGGCESVGSPEVIQGGCENGVWVLPTGEVLTVSDDYHDVYLNGEAAGSLGDSFQTLLPEGESGEAIIFTAGGPEWFSEGRCQGGAPAGLSVSLSAEEVQTALTAQVVCPTLKGDYPRGAGDLASADRQAVVAAVREALGSLSAQAEGAGMFVGPFWASWRLEDSAGRVISAGAPERLGAIQGNGLLTFTATHSGSTFSVETSARISVTPRRLRVRVGRAESEFWRARGARLRVGLWGDCQDLTGVSGSFVAADSEHYTLGVTPYIAEREREAGTGPTAEAAVERPLEGVSECPSVGRPSATDWDSAAGERLRVSFAYRSGTAVAYALADAPGVIAVAPGGNPLDVRLRLRVCSGRILHICSPVGSGGGWNYGRHHLLAFGTDGVYAVSVDSRLQSGSSSRLSERGIGRADAVAVTPSGVVFVATDGTAMRLRGARAEGVSLPFRAAAAGWSGTYGELWIADSQGCAVTIDERGRASRRSDLTVSKFAGQSMAVDSTGSLRNLGLELPAPKQIEWRRRVEEQLLATVRRARWLLDSERATGLRLTLAADGGGSARRVLELEVNGPVNAPVEAHYRSPRRAYLTAGISGVVYPRTRLKGVWVSS